MLEVPPLEQNLLGLRVLLHHNAINTNVTELTQHKNCRVMLPHDHQENTNPTLRHYHKNLYLHFISTRIDKLQYSNTDDLLRIE